MKCKYDLVWLRSGWSWAPASSAWHLSQLQLNSAAPDTQESSYNWLAQGGPANFIYIYTEDASSQGMYGYVSLPE